MTPTIFKLRAQWYKAGKRIYSFDSMDPILAMEKITLPDHKILYLGYPISFSWELAGKGVPFFEKYETELRIPFILEVWNYVIIPEEIVLKKLTTIHWRVLREKMEIAKYINNESEYEILLFREKEKEKWRRLEAFLLTEIERNKIIFT
jgi:hypothetical protein